MNASFHLDRSSPAVPSCVKRASESLLQLRRPDGQWRGLIDAGVTPAVDWLLLEVWRRRSGTGGDEERAGRIRDTVLSQQLDGGGFASFAGGPLNLDLTVKAYAALRLTGLVSEDAALRRCRDAVAVAGALGRTGALTRLDLSFLGLCPRESCLSFPVEMMLFRRRLLEPLSHWARAAMVPAAIVQHFNTAGEDAERWLVEELDPGGQGFGQGGAGWLRWWGRSGAGFLRRRALQAAEEWLVDRVRKGDPSHCTFPAIRYSSMALELLGYGFESVEQRKLQNRLDELVVEAGGKTLVQPYSAPVRDTATAVRTVDEVQAAPRVKFQRTADWLIETQRPEAGGDWGSWPIRIEDTAFVLLGLQRMEASSGRAQDLAVQKAIRWLLAAQSDDGGWASFVPVKGRFSAPAMEWIDHRSLADATSPGTTGLVLEAICHYGSNGRDPAVRRGVDFLVDRQHLDGSWLGPWMGSYIGATCFAVQGLAAAGEDPSEPHLLRAGEWLRSVQNADGGWGEDPSGFHAGEYAPAASGAVQTARALLGLIVSGDHASDSVERGVRYLAERQSEGGDWPANGPTGTWQAGAFHVRCDLDRICYPLLALARYQAARAESSREGR